MPLSNLSDAEFQHALWTFASGSILFLLHSIYSQTVRNWWSLMIGCIFGGVGSWVAGQIWHDSEYIYIICGVAAIVTSHLLQAVSNAAKELSDRPIHIGVHLAKVFLPTFGKQVGTSDIPPSGNDYKADAQFPYEEGSDYPYDESEPPSKQNKED